MDEWIDRYRQLLRQYGLNTPISISREIGKKIMASEYEILLNDERISEAELRGIIPADAEVQPSASAEDDCLQRIRKGDRNREHHRSV